MISAVKVLAAPVVIRLPPVVTQSGLMERPALLSGKPDSGFRHPFAQRLSRHDQAVVRRNPLSHKIDYGTMTSGAGPGIAVAFAAGDKLRGPLHVELREFRLLAERTNDGLQHQLSNRRYGADS